MLTGEINVLVELFKVPPPSAVTSAGGEQGSYVFVFNRVAPNQGRAGDAKRLFPCVKYIHFGLVGSCVVVKGFDSTHPSLLPRLSLQTFSHQQEQNFFGACH